MSHDLTATLPAPLQSIRTRHLFAMSLEVKPMQIVGDAPGGFRRVGVVTGGSFEGERLRGVVLDGGADWQVVRPNGSVTLDVRLVLKTSDGAMIGMTYSGIRAGPAEMIQRLESGQAVEPGDYYFKTTPRFETAAENYAWLNDLIAVGAGHRFPDGPIYNVFEVL